MQKEKEESGEDGQLKQIDGKLYWGGGVTPANLPILFLLLPLVILN